MATGPRAPVDVMLPYGAYRASDGRTAAATDRRDVGPGPERARGRSFDPGCGSCPKGVAKGAHGGDRGGTETAVVLRGQQGGKGVLMGGFR